MVIGPAGRGSVTANLDPPKLVPPGTYFPENLFPPELFCTENLDPPDKIWTPMSLSLGTRPFAEEEGSGHVPTFELSLRNAIMRGN